MDSSDRAIAVVGLGAILPDAPSPTKFWTNLVAKRYSITEVPPGRWLAADYYDPDPSVPDKTYSKIGGWVRGFTFDWKQFRVPPRVAAAMDEGQQWAVTVAAQALADYGYPARPLDKARVAVILGTAMGGELHYKTHQRIAFPEYVHALEGVEAFGQLPRAQRSAILDGFHAAVAQQLPPITEDSMPGELPNIVSGRVANLLDLHGPNFITDAACASALAAVDAAVELLVRGEVDAVVTGGVDRNMGVSPFVKFAKIGALSATGTRPFGDGADGFVMGEGAAAFLLKRLADAERAGDRVYAVIRGVGGASDGRGKGITAPNPAGQQLAIRRAWENAGLDPASATLVEAHGTSTRVGDVVEVESLAAVFGAAPPGSIGLGSVKSNIGHLKAAAGAAGLLKAVLALQHQVLPPTLHGQPPNPNIDFGRTPFYLLHEARPWTLDGSAPRRCGVSAYGFGGTNFHVVVEEPGAIRAARKTAQRLTATPTRAVHAAPATSNAGGATAAPPAPLRGLLCLGGATVAELAERTAAALERARRGWAPDLAPPDPADAGAPERLVIDFGSPAELAERLEKSRKAMTQAAPAVWKALQPQGIFRGSGPPAGQVAFLFPGQGSQYLNMGRELAARSPVVQAVLAEADEVMTPILGRPLSTFLFVDGQDPAALKAAEQGLTQTAVTQPAMLALDTALCHLLQAYGFQPAMVMGHSLGEYAALIAAGVMPFADALEAASARGAEMTRVSVEDNGWMAAVMAPYPVVEATLKEIDGYVVAANINSYNQCVVGGGSRAVEQAMAVFQAKGYEARRLPVSHAFHTQIVAPASGPLRQVLDRLHIGPPTLPLVANVTGEFYPTAPEAIKDLLQQQIAAPVQWVKGLETLYAAGARVFVEVGPKKALKGLVDDVLGQREGVVSLYSNHPKTGELASFNQALCGLYAAGLAVGVETPAPPAAALDATRHVEVNAMPTPSETTPLASNGARAARPSEASEHMAAVPQAARQWPGQEAVPAYDRNAPPPGSVVISGTGLGLPGPEKRVMDPDNALRILRGEQFVDLLPERFRQRMLDKRVTRLVKAEDGSGRFEHIVDTGDVIKLAGRPGAFDLSEEYGVPAKLVEALDITSQLAMAAGLDALREAGLPLVQTYRRTSTGRFLPDRWLLPEPLRDETGVIFASAFPGGDRFANELQRYYAWQNRLDQVDMLEDLRPRLQADEARAEIDRRLAELREQMAREPYEFDRRFLFRVLAMGHSQFAEYIGARGPNTQVNAACASTTQAIGMAEDWIRNGRCRRVVVIAADDVTSDNMLEWVGAGFLATGAVATDDRVDEAALPFDRRRHGTLMGMGACALVLESEDAVRERGMRALVELLASETNNSAFHGTRLDVEHIAQVMEALLTSAERRFGLHRLQIAPELVFMSHETFTPARGGSASAEVVALRRNFGEAASEVVVANTKGFTGHPMGVGIEDVIAVKILEYGRVPPVPNYKEVDPELGRLNLSRGGRYPVQYVLHLAAGFGSQIAMTLTRRIPGGPDRVCEPIRYRRWLAEVSGQDQAELEVIKRVLRLQAEGKPGRPPRPSNWRPGTGPTQRAVSAAPFTRPAEAWPEPYVPARPGALPDTSIQVLPGQPAAAPENGHAKPAVAPPPVETPHPARTAVEAPAAEPAAVPPAAVPTAGADGDPVAEAVLRLVADKTGYPRDMLDLDLDLEADLGIDTVKQAETFAAIRAAFDIPRQENLRLRDYPTLKHVIEFVHAKQPAAAEAGSERTPAPASPPAAAETPAGAEPPAEMDEVVERVLSIVADKTGYPSDMLDLDLDLEADLGIDTVKQAETFAAIRTAFNIPRQETLRLRDYPTLSHVIGFVRQNQAKPASEGRSASADAGEAEPAAEDEAGSRAPTRPPPRIAAARPEPGRLEAADSLPRRVPWPALRPTLGLCKATGVRLEAGTRVIVRGDGNGFGSALVGQLQQRGVTVLPLAGPQAPEALDGQLTDWLASGPIDGVYWLKALEVEPALEVMNLAAWRTYNQERVKDLYRVMRALITAGSGRAGTGQPPFLVTATRLGGLHGYGPEGAEAPLGGAVIGFAKAYKREQPLALVKAVDFDLRAGLSNSLATVAETLIAETLADPGAVEIGVRGPDRFAITLVEAPAVADGTGLKLSAESVYLATGAAGGITSAIVTDLAAANGGIYYLLDLTPLPGDDDERIALFRAGRDNLKQHLIAAARSAGERPTPATIDRQILDVERQEAALRAVETIRAAGGTAHYRRVDLLDGEAVAAVVEEIRQRHGRLDVLIHAAGLEISRTLAEKPPAQFNLVYDVKADGYFNLLRAAAGLPISAVVVFSSVAGRFGNAGQTDYAAANDLLCRMTSSLRAWRPATRGVAIDWSAWSGIGMATRGSIPKLMEAAGIERVPPEAGVPTVRRELTYSAFSGEVVVAGKLGLLLDEWDPAGGLDLERAQARAQQPPQVMIGTIKAARLYGGWEVETTLDPQVQPFLHDHALEGTPLLPGVMGIEAFAELAHLAAPGYVVTGARNVRFERPLKFYRGQPRTLTLTLSLLREADGGLRAAGTLRSTRQPRPDLPAQSQVHFTGEVCLGRQAPTAAATAAPPRPSARDAAIGHEAIYRKFFHGPAYQVLEQAHIGTDQAVGVWRAKLPDDAVPAGGASQIGPRLIELCFQTAGLWEMEMKHRLGLPRGLGAVTVLARAGQGPRGALYAVVRPVPGGDRFEGGVVDEQGKVYLSFSDYQTVPLDLGEREPEAATANAAVR